MCWYHLLRGNLTFCLCHQTAVILCTSNLNECQNGYFYFIIYLFYFIVYIISLLWATKEMEPIESVPGNVWIPQSRQSWCWMTEMNKYAWCINICLCISEALTWHKWLLLTLQHNYKASWTAESNSCWVMRGYENAQVIAAAAQ